jgi:hypothetical protein
VAVEKTFAKRRGKRAVSPVISTVILTGVMVALVGVALVFANGLLWSKIAENDFNSAKQFMQTVGLTLDDVAWTVGRTETIGYSSKYGSVTNMSSTLNYTVSANVSGTYQTLASYTVGVILFNIRTSMYSMTNGYWEPIFPSKSTNLTLTGTSAPVARVFAVEKLPMSDGNYIRVVVAPSIRLMNSTIVTSGNSTYYVKLYLANPTVGSSPRRSQTVTLTGNNVNAKTLSGVTQIKVTVGFPKQVSGFDNTFFHFLQTSQVITIPSKYTSGAVLEFYVGGVTVNFGIS